jgi:hypothetical protein
LSSKGPSNSHYLSIGERPRLPFTARIERAHSDRARSASKKGTWPLPFPLLAAFFNSLLVDHSNGRITKIQCRLVGSIDRRVAIAQHGTILVEARLKREIEPDGLGFQ